jgi:cell wall-active antibiotic response 4TMS protein YvqF/B-box zinc finger protein
MKCAVHTEVEATGYCRNCGKALCPECQRNVRGALYCEDCLARSVSGSVTGPATLGPGQPVARGIANPGAALALGFIPGLGAVYNGEYLKALIHVIIFGGLIAAQKHQDMPGGYHAFLGIALFAFYFYMPVEAYRSAKAREMGEPAPPDLIEGEGRKPIGAIILISLGIFFLLENFGLLEWDWFDKVWPIGLIGLGAWLLKDRLKKDA